MRPREAIPGDQSIPRRPVSGVWVGVDEREQCHLIAGGLQLLRNLHGNEAAKAVAGEQIGAGRLDPPHLLDMGGGEFLDPRQRRAAGRLDHIDRLSNRQRVGELPVFDGSPLEAVGYEQRWHAARSQQDEPLCRGGRFIRDEQPLGERDRCRRVVEEDRRHRPPGKLLELDCDRRWLSCCRRRARRNRRRG